VDESEIKTPRFGRVSRDLNPEFEVGTLNPKTFESGDLWKRFSLESGYFSACDLLSLRWNENGGLHDPVVVEL